MFFHLLSLLVLLLMQFSLVFGCNPPESTSNTSVTVSMTGGGSGSVCYFPFVDGSNTYYDCAEYCSGQCRYWCATSCDYGASSSLWRYCNYRLANLTQENCSALATAAQSNEPSVLYAGAGSGTKCVFPFLYNGKCHYDCIITSIEPWCATTAENALVYFNYKYCAYTLAGVASESCARLNSSAPVYITPQLSSYSIIYTQADPYANCTFPFYYKGKCYNDCISGAGFPWYLIWCITERYYQPNRRIRFCPYFRSYASIKTLPLQWGFYRIYLQTGCGSGGSLCNASIVAANSTAPLAAYGSRRLALAAPAANGATMWEAMPQPNGFFIFRSVVPCYTPADAWSTDNLDATFENITREREFWIVDSAGGTGRSGLYTIKSSFNDTAGFYLKPSTVSGYSVLTLDSSVTTVWLFEEITDLEKSKLSLCDKLDINGGWCNWTEWTTVSSEWQMRERNCSCPTVAGNGTSCQGNSTDWRPIVNGTWCSWSAYTPFSGGYSTRTRACACPAPANSGLDCPGSGNDTGLVINGSWCGWSSFSLAAGVGTRTRQCNCSAPAYGGSDCPGSAIDSGAVVNGSWCSWSSFSVASGVGSRTRQCNCSAPAYGGNDCVGSASDSGPTVNGSWCSWSAFTVSSGIGTRTRECNCSAPEYGGATCTGSGMDSGTVINGTWCGWSAFSVVAGVGTRTRRCNCSAPSYGGEDCYGMSNETGTAVNGSWCSWSAFSVTSGIGTRTRLCNCSAAEFGGQDCPGSATESGATIDGGWCSWSAFQVYGSFSNRSRLCNCSAPAYGGQPCPGSATETQAVVNGTWCPWGPYIVSGPNSTRTRVCNCSAPAYGGLDCIGAASETQTVVNGSWCAWSGYTLSPGGDYGTRIRACACPAFAYGGADCPGSGNDTGLKQDVAWCAWSSYVVNPVDGIGTRNRTCACPAVPAYGGSSVCSGNATESGLAVNATWCAWSAYSADGFGNETRQRNCSCPIGGDFGGSTVCPGSTIDTRQIVNGSWCLWSSYTVQNGWGIRNRTCECPMASALGLACAGNTTDSLAQVNGSWCTWSSLIYSYGEVFRTRQCNCSAPNEIGVTCAGDTIERYPCNDTACATTTTQLTSTSAIPGSWCPWGDFTPGPFNSGYMYRQRQCACPAPSGNNGGSTCPGSSLENVTCRLVACTRYMAIPSSRGDSGTSFNQLSSFAKLVGFGATICAASILALAIGAILTLCKVAGGGSGATAPA